MQVFYEDPHDGSMYKWMDDEGVHDIWYRDVTMLFHYKEEDIPAELSAFLDRWTEKIAEYMKDYRELYPVKLAKIQFIYRDVVYAIYPTTVGATYETDFMSDTPYTVSWDSLFECYEKEIRDALRDELGVIHSKYIGFLD